MEFMLDTLNINEIKKWARVLPLAGKVIKLLQPQFILYFKVFWLLKQAQITLLPIIIEWRT